MNKEKAKKKKASRKIKWKTIRVKATQLNPTPNNYKIKSELGQERLQMSLNKYGKAGTIVANYAKQKGKFDIIDGNSRWEDEMEDNPNNVMEVSVPSRVLTKVEYEEMAAMFDFAVAGEVDIDRIKKEKGTTKDFYERWGLEVPFEVLEKLGSKADLSTLNYPKAKKGRNMKSSMADTTKGNNTMQINLFFTIKQEGNVRKWEVKFMKKFKTDNITDTTYKVYETLAKNLKF